LAFIIKLFVIVYRGIVSLQTLYLYSFTPPLKVKEKTEADTRKTPCSLIYYALLNAETLYWVNTNGMVSAIWKGKQYWNSSFLLAIRLPFSALQITISKLWG